MRQIGLAQGLVNFTRIFGTSAESVHSSHHRLILYEPEDGIWIHACIDLGYKQAETKNKREYIDNVSDHALNGMLRRLYRHYKLLNGSLTRGLEEGADVLRRRLDLFFSTRIWTSTFGAESVGDLFRPVESLPLDESITAQLSTRMNLLHEKHGNIKECLVWRMGRLVMSSNAHLTANDLHALRDHLDDTKPSSPRVNGSAAENKAKSSPMAGFLDLFSRSTIAEPTLEAEQAPPPPTAKLRAVDDIQSLPIWIEYDDGEMTRCDLVTYDLSELTITAIMEHTEDRDTVNEELLESLSEFTTECHSTLPPIQTPHKGTKETSKANIKSRSVSVGDTPRDTSSIDAHIYQDETSGLGQSTATANDAVYYQDHKADLDGSVHQVIARSAVDNVWYAATGEGDRKLFTTHRQPETSLSDVDSNLHKMFEESRI